MADFADFGIGSARVTGFGLPHPRGFANLRWNGLWQGRRAASV